MDYIFEISNPIQTLYAGMAVFMWLFTLLFSKEYMGHEHARPRYYAFMLATFAGTFGVFVSGDFLTLFVCFEIMSIASYVLVIHEENEKCMRAGETYLAVAVIGGMVMLMGLFLLNNLCGTLSIAGIKQACTDLYQGPQRGQLYTACALIMFGFAAKAGVFPLHIWLPKAHPVAPAPASALLSGILTKAGIFGMLIISTIFIGDYSWGRVLSVLAMITMIVGAVLALFSTDLKRTLACSSVSQIGFITCGIAFMCLLPGENQSAVYGAVLHMVNHSLIKLVLFLSAGAVYMKAHTLELNKLRGFGKRMPWLMPCFAVGALSISGVPGFSGFMSKTFLHEAITEFMEYSAIGGEFVIYEKLFTITGGLTFAYMLKLFICLFVQGPKPTAEEKAAAKCTLLSKLSIAIPAAVLFVLGIELNIDFITLHAVEAACISLAIGAAVYILIIRCLLARRPGKDSASYGIEYKDCWPKWLDLENSIYRPLIKFLLSVLTFICSILAGITDAVVAALSATVLRTINPGANRITFRERIAASDIGRSFANVRASAEEFTQTLSFGMVSGLLGLCIFLLVLLLK